MKILLKPSNLDPRARPLESPDKSCQTGDSDPINVLVQYIRLIGQKSR